MMVSSFPGLSCCSCQGIQTHFLGESLSREPQHKCSWPRDHENSVGPGHPAIVCIVRVSVGPSKGRGGLVIDANPDGTPESCQELVKNKLQGPTLKRCESVGVRQLRNLRSAGSQVWPGLDLPSWITFPGCRRSEPPLGPPLESQGVGGRCVHIRCAPG